MLAQCSISIPQENVRKNQRLPDVFRVYRNGTLDKSGFKKEHWEEQFN